jgi:beta-glucosidase/6-phospho-beta-glucosidase/beta-galactosidase
MTTANISSRGSTKKEVPGAPSQDGFEQRFGLYHVDFATKCRTPKLSVSFYRETIARNAVV